MTTAILDGARLLGRLSALGAIGRDGEGRLARLAATDADRAGRAALMGWMDEAGLAVTVDRIGNVFGRWSTAENEAAAPLLLGSHIDSVVNAGMLDGCYGVLGALEVIETLKAAGARPARPIVVAAFTNEEGARFAPDMLGSLVFVGGLALDTALATVGVDGARLGDELARIGAAGTVDPGHFRPAAYVELHIEQGPILDREGVRIGAVENLQGISWQEVTIEGTANHAGTTPMTMRRDAGLAAARTVAFLADRANRSNTPTVATVGRMRFAPDVINVVPSRAIFTVDLRDPDETRLREEEAALAAHLDGLVAEGFRVTVERLARFEPVVFDAALVGRIEAAAAARGLSCRRMTSGAGHDAQMLARICPAAMIFVPSRDGISHNPREHTDAVDLVAGAEVLLDVVRSLAEDGDVG